MIIKKTPERLTPTALQLIVKIIQLGKYLFKKGLSHDKFALNNFYD